MTTLDIDRFIIEIEDRPAIWDVRCNDYSNKIAKAKAWEEMCDNFVPGFIEMKLLGASIVLSVFYDDDGGAAKAEVMQQLRPQSPCWN